MAYTQVHTSVDPHVQFAHVFERHRWLHERGVGVCHLGYLDQQLGWPGPCAIVSDLLRGGVEWGSRIERQWAGSVIISNSVERLSWLFPPPHREVALLFKLTWGGQ